MKSTSQEDGQVNERDVSHRQSEGMPWRNVMREASAIGY